MTGVIGGQGHVTGVIGGQGHVTCLWVPITVTDSFAHDLCIHFIQIYAVCLNKVCAHTYAVDSDVFVRSLGT